MIGLMLQHSHKMKNTMMMIDDVTLLMMIDEFALMPTFDKSILHLLFTWHGVENLVMMLLLLLILLLMLLIRPMVYCESL